MEKKIREITDYEEDIQHCNGVIGAQTSQPDSTRPTTFQAHFPQEFSSPYVSELSNQNVPQKVNTRDRVPSLQLREALSL